MIPDPFPPDGGGNASVADEIVEDAAIDAVNRVGWSAIGQTEDPLLPSTGVQETWPSLAQSADGFGNLPSSQSNAECFPEVDAGDMELERPSLVLKESQPLSSRPTFSEVLKAPELGSPSPQSAFAVSGTQLDDGAVKLLLIANDSLKKDVNKAKSSLKQTAIFMVATDVNVIPSRAFFDSWLNNI